MQKYFYLNGQKGILWDKVVWVKRLYYCLSEKEEDLGVQIVNLSKDGPIWMQVLPTLLDTPHFSWKITPFKGVTDILVLGRKGLPSMVVTDMEVERTTFSYMSSGTIVVEVGLDKPKLIDCVQCGLLLPRKLGELLSSMYLVGVINSLKHINTDCIKVYGWLILRSTFSVAVELRITSSSCVVDILWMTSNFVENMSNQFQYLVKQIK